MDDALLRGFVELALNGRGGGDVAPDLCLFKEGLETRFDVAVAQFALFRLADPLFGGFDVGQRGSPINDTCG